MTTINGRNSPRGARAGWILSGIALTATALGVAGCKERDVIGGSDSVQHEAQHQTYEHKIDAIEVTLDSGEARLTGGGTATIDVDRVLKWPTTKPSITEEWRGNTLVITGHCFGQRNCSTDYVIRLPAGTPVKVSSDGGSLTTDGLDASQQLSTNGGDITVNSAKGALTLRTDGGNIRGTTLSSTQTTADTAGGEITLSYSGAPDKVTANTDGGNIDVAVPKPSEGGYRVDASTSGGNRTVDVPSDSGASRSVTVHAEGGNVRVHYS